MAAATDKDKMPNLSMNIQPTSILHLLPTPWHPYIEVTRMHIPPTNLVVFYPFLVATFFSAAKTSTSLSTLLPTLGKLYILSLLSGATGHVLDDYLDHAIDSKYARCQSRPIVRGAISPRSALRWANLLSTLYILATITLLGREYTLDAIVFVAACWMYPLSKRFWNYPQLIVGPLHAFPILYVTRYVGVGNERDVGALFVGFAAFTMLFDTGYALLDVEEDVRFGVGSMAVRFRGSIKGLLVVLGVVHSGALALTGLWAGFGSVYIGCSALSCLETLTLILKLDPNRPKSVIIFFVLVVLLVGGQMIASLATEWAMGANVG